MPATGSTSAIPQMKRSPLMLATNYTAANVTSKCFVRLARSSPKQLNQPTNQPIMNNSTNTILHATQRLLDSVWTLTFVAHEDDTATILRYDRTNEIGYEQERNLPRVRLTEDADRNVTGIALGDYADFQYTAPSGSMEIPVRNVQNVFSYSA
jgi:hypothetical protein